MAFCKNCGNNIPDGDMLGNILMAQNFNMPAGYITEGEEQYLVKVGEEYASLEELENTLLMHMDVDGVGDVRRGNRARQGRLRCGRVPPRSRPRCDESDTRLSQMCIRDRLRDCP